MLPGQMQERRGEDVRQVAEVTRQDPEAHVEPVAVGPVGRLDHPEQQQERHHHDQGVPQPA
jgi:hypothetical protein